MSTLTWRHEPFTDGHGTYHAEPDGQVRIDYCGNARPMPWRTCDNRGVGTRTPKPVQNVFHFAATLREAKAWAEANDWHLDVAARQGEGER